MSAPERDIWADWVMERSHGGDAARAAEAATFHTELRRRVLAGAAIEPGDVVLDVGCGSGLIGLGALELLGDAGRVVFSDISERLLAEAAARAGGDSRASFAQARAEDLAPIGAASVDVVVLRSVLIYVHDKSAAFAEMARVLRPGGRVSLFEPINRFCRWNVGATIFGFDLGDALEEAEKVKSVYAAIQPPTDPMIDFDERDLVAHAEAAGFFPVAVDLELRVEPMPPQDWDSLVAVAPNPRVPTLGEAMAQVLTASEQERLTRALQPLVEEGRGERRMAHCYLRATKPGP